MPYSGLFLQNSTFGKENDLKLYIDQLQASQKMRLEGDYETIRTENCRLSSTSTILVFNHYYSGIKTILL